MKHETLGRLHVITDTSLQARFTHAELARLAAAGGADTVQFREKRPRTTAELVREARATMTALAGSGTSLIVNDRVDVCAAAGAAGVHLGRHDLPAATARQLLGHAHWIGGTANSLAEARAVADSPVDYLGVGPVFGTQSKADPAPRLGIEQLRAIVAASPHPVIAIGSIDAGNVAEVLDAGAYGAAVLSAVVGAADPQEATARLREALTAWLAAAAAPPGLEARP